MRRLLALLILLSWPAHSRDVGDFLPSLPGAVDWTSYQAPVVDAPPVAPVMVLPGLVAPTAVPTSAQSFAQCEASIGEAEKRQHIPAKLMPAISRVESGRLDPVTKRLRAWPWTINVEGTGYFFGTKAEAIAAVQALQAKGPRSIDVGCMQVNLIYHPHAFVDLEDAFDPSANARYAARFLTALYQQTKDWNLATAAYHSQDAERGEEYQRLVFGRVMTPMVKAAMMTIKPTEMPSISFGAFGKPAAQFAAFAGAFTPAPAKR